MLAPSFTREDLDQFLQRPGIRIAKDIYALANENFAAIDVEQSGSITTEELSQYAGNQKLKDFLYEHGERLSCLSFTAKSLPDLLLDGKDRIRSSRCRISFSDLNTFRWLSEEINRRNFYDGNFQCLREGAGLNAAGVAFLCGIFAGLAALGILFAKLHILVPPVEAIAIGIIATIGLPICSAMMGYFFGTTQADRYFRVRVESIDRILDHLERSI